MGNNNSCTVVLTVGNECQKTLCETLAADINEKPDFDIQIISDAELGCRIGSGGAVLKTLERFYSENTRLIIVNSGGMSKRSVNYAVRGKAFANLSVDSNQKVLLDLILLNARRILSQIKSGTVICCSDILVDTSKINMTFDYSVGFCAKADIETGTRHGVMFADDKGFLTDFLHKKEKSKLEAYCDVEKNSVSVDTGMLYFNDELCSKLCQMENKEQLCNRLLKNKIELNLYPEIVGLLSKNTNKNYYILSDAKNEEHKKIRQILYDYLHGILLKVCDISAEFIHFGSLDESRKNILALSKEKQYVKINSYISDNSTVGVATVLDNVMLDGQCSIGNNCLISDVTFDDCCVPDDTAVCGVKLKDGSFCTIVTSIKENPKECDSTGPLWNKPRFYKGKSFSDSYQKFLDSNCKEEKFSLDFLMQNVDYNYYLNRIQYLKNMDSFRISSLYLQRREEILKHHFKLNPMLESVHCKKTRVEKRLPLRVNLSGTWTDAMPYCIDNGGQVINMAVTLDNKLPILVTVEKLEENRIEFSSDGVLTQFSFQQENYEEDLSDFILHISALKTIGFSENIAIDCGFRLSTLVTDVDKGSGLGTSSILLGGCIEALSEFFGIKRSKNEILKMVFVAEQIMKTGGGWQDQVGGLYPSIKAGTTQPGIEQEISVDFICYHENINELFSNRLVLLPTGQRHFGRFIVNDVVNRYIDKNEQSLKGHIEIRKLNDNLKLSLENGDIDGLCYCINQHRELLKLISPLVTNETIDAMVDRCMDVADAVSFLGAGGGGYLLVVLKENVSITTFKRFVADNFKAVKSSVKKIDIYEG